MIEKLLVIPDAHAHPDHDNERFEWLGKHIVESRPSHIVCLGDFGDMPSLSSYDRGKKGFEGRRYVKDVAATIDANQRLWRPVDTLNKSLKARKKAPYEPVRIILRGNHEQRIDTCVSCNPELDGQVSFADLCYEADWDHVIPFKEYVVIGGVCFVHYLPNALGRAVGGKNHARSLINNTHMSMVVGHSHQLDYAADSRPDGSRLFGLVAGCYAHPEYIEGFNKGVTEKYWYGVVELEGIKNGYPQNVKFIHMDNLKGKYA